MKQQTFYLYDHPTKAHHYLITNEERDCETWGFFILQSDEKQSLNDFIVDLCKNGYPFERIETHIITPDKPEVNIVLADLTFTTMLNYFRRHVPTMNDEIENIEVCWKLLGENPSFAHKLSKELKRLNS